VAGQLDVVAIVGSLRRESWNRRVLGLAAELAPAPVHLELVELHGIPLYDDDVHQAGDPAPVQALRDRLSRADGVILNSPEYNLGISGVVKNALDWLSRPFLEGPLVGKPVAVITVSPGRSEPERAAAQVRLTAEACGALPLPPPDLAIRSIGRRVDPETGTIGPEVTGPLAELLERFTRFINEARQGAA
jgi:chromate reductase